MDLHNVLITICVYALPMIFAITLHEAAHGFVAKHYGDSTAYMLGRVTLNPMKHIDLVGTILVPLVTKLIGGFFFGWAKPVPVNFNNLREPQRRNTILVAFAGPFSNMVQVIAWALLAKLLLATVPMTGLVAPFWVAVAEAGISVNIMFALLNLLPVLPLDGGRIVAGLLPPRASYTYSRTEPYGLFILLALMFTGALNWMLGAPFTAAMRGTYALFGFQ
jgi:Zn-dependent protease